MKGSRTWLVAAMIVTLVLVRLQRAGDGASTQASVVTGAELATVRLQLQWTPRPSSPATTPPRSRATTRTKT